MIYLLNYNSNISLSYIDVLYTYGYFPLILLATRITSAQSSLIDHGFFNNNLTGKIKSGNIYDNDTDHLPNYIMIPLHNVQNNTTKMRPIIRMINSCTKAKFKTMIDDINWDFITYNNANVATENFLTILHGCFEKCFPFKKIPIRTYKNKNWITDVIIKKRRLKNKMYKEYCHNKSDITRAKYLKSKNEVANMIKYTK